MLLVTAKARLLAAQKSLKKAQAKLAAREKAVKDQKGYIAKVRKRVSDRQATDDRLTKQAELGRLKPNVAVSMNVACQSARSGGSVNLIVLHDTESHNASGSSDLQAIGNFFNQ